jgi:hypothetical protein
MPLPYFLCLTGWKTEDRSFRILILEQKISRLFVNTGKKEAIHN